MTHRTRTSALATVLVAGGFALSGIGLSPVPAAAQGQAPAASPATYQVTGTLRVDGGSTLRSWSCEAETLNAQVSGPAGAALGLADLEGVVQALRLEIPATELECNNDTMNDHMWNALKTEDFPRILFTMSSYAVTPGADGAQLQLRGELEIAGQTRPLTLVAQAAPHADGGLQVLGVHELNMTEWDIRPPRLMLGTLRVDEEVQIHFDLRLAPR